jgi:hypothetical protein
MARRSFDTYQTWLGLPGNPVEFLEFYDVEDARTAASKTVPAQDPRPKFAELESELLGDLATKI